MLGNHQQEGGGLSSSFWPQREQREMSNLNQEVSQLCALVGGGVEYPEWEGQEKTVLCEVLRMAQERVERTMKKDQLQQQRPQCGGTAKRSSECVSLPFLSQQRQKTWGDISSIDDALPISSFLMEEEEEVEEGEAGWGNQTCIEEEEDAELEALEHMRGEISLLEHRIKFRFRQESEGGVMSTPWWGGKGGEEM